MRGQAAMFVALFVFGLTCVACRSNATPASSSSQPYKLGAVFDITGPASSLGVPERDTITMLAQQLNDRGGIKGPDDEMHILQMVIYDDQSKEDECVKIAKKLIDEDDVVAIIGPSQSGTSLAIVDTVQESGVTLISSGSSIKIVTPTEQRKWVFKIPQSDSLVISVLVDYLKSKGHTKVAFISVNTAFGDSGRAEFWRAAPAAGIGIVCDERFETTDTTTMPQLTRIRGTDAQAVVVWAIPPAASVAAKDARSLGLTIPMYHSHGIANRTFIELAGDAANGVIFPVGKLLIAESLPDSDPQKTVLLQYDTDFEAMYGRPADTFGGHAWDALMMSAACLEQVGPDRAKFRHCLENTRDFVGVTGVFNYSAQDHSGLDERAVTMVQIVDGQWKPAP